ncbi:Os01g0337180 [Oryza sativa Japonica Group]|uniref:Os01g0337180 protein n=1 Tax=Oryza sativa subsp. japonica TaxID=39947 RepID=A0A0P0V1X6_ORYSJ|nr:hypothetical protein EE612_002330 [Oryza sativa]BAS71944.1 Os01g0337180 [Oryza sativa Japonica Group]
MSPEPYSQNPHPISAFHSLLMMRSLFTAAAASRFTALPSSLCPDARPPATIPACPAPSRVSSGIMYMLYRITNV